MKTLKLLIVLFVLAVFFNSCENSVEPDKEKPVIDLSIQDAFPTNCDTLYFGETFEFKALFSDNKELGSIKAFSIDIHNNFDHHSHSTEVEKCDLDPKKTPINPFIYIDSFDIPSGKKEYETINSITIPSGNDKGDFDEGDYHFFISLTDKEGWSTQRGLSIKMLHR